MALRVLLADESSTIKKVVQLTLQDFDVDVRSVSVGLDVLSVAKSFRPDVVMADVLLAKRSGYEICHDLKNDPETASIPVVLMWSGFMEIDEQKARLSGADRRIEKPFDPSSLRNIVKELVQKTQSNPVSSYVQFPPLPEFQEQNSQPAAASQPEISKSAAPQPAAESRPTIPAAPPSDLKIPFPDGESQNNASSAHISFSGMETTNTNMSVVMPSDDSVILDDTEPETQDEWVQKPPPRPPPSSITSKPLHNQKPSSNDDFAEFQLTEAPEKAATTAAAQMGAQMGAQFGPAQEEILRQEIQKWLTAHMPTITERIIRDEINRLLQDSEQTIETP